MKRYIKKAMLLILVLAVPTQSFMFRRVQPSWFVRYKKPLFWSGLSIVVAAIIYAYRTPLYRSWKTRKWSPKLKSLMAKIEKQETITGDECLLSSAGEILVLKEALLSEAGAGDRKSKIQKYFEAPDTRVVDLRLACEASQITTEVLHEAVKKDDLDFVRLLFAQFDGTQKYEFLRKTEGWEAIKHAAINNSTAMLQLIFEQLNQKQKFWFCTTANGVASSTVLYWASRENNVGMIKTLFAGLSLEQKYTLLRIADKNNMAALQWAVRNDNTEMVQEMIHGFNRKQLYYLLSMESSIAACEKRTVLHVAAEKARLETIRKLLDPFISCAKKDPSCAKNLDALLEAFDERLGKGTVLECAKLNRHPGVALYFEQAHNFAIKKQR